MALGSKDGTTQLASPSTGNNVPVVAHVEDLIDIDSHSELIFETPPPDVVDSINECFEHYTSTVERRSDAMVHQPLSDRDESLFMTQSRTKAVQTKRLLGSSERPESISDDSGNGRENEDTGNRRNGDQQAKSPITPKKAFFARRANFPFPSKSLRRKNIPVRKHQILENSEMGGFLKCIWKIEDNCVKTKRAISPSLLESDLSDDDNSDHEVTQVDRIIFVQSYSKRNNQQWLPQSFLEMRNEAQSSCSSVKQSKCKLRASKSRAAVRTLSELSADSVLTEHVVLTACSDAKHLLTSKQKKKKKLKLKVQESGADTHSANNVHAAEMDQFSESQTTEMTLKRTKKKRKDKERTKMAHRQPEHIHTSEKISGLKSDRKKKKKKNGIEESQYESVDFALDVNSVSQFDDVTDRLTPQERVEERSVDVLEHTQAELNSAEHSDSVQCAGNLHGDHLSVIEDGQRSSVKAVTEQAVEHKDDLTSDNNLPNNSSYLLPPQGGDISIQDDVQQTDSDFGSEDLFRPLNSQELEDNQIHKTASITANMEKSDQDSDVTQIETEGQFVSIFGPGTPRWCDGDRHTYEDNDSDETQIETEEKSVSVFGPGTSNKQFTSQDMNSAKNPESQKTDLTPVGLNKKRKTVSRSHKESDGTDVPETLNVQPSSEHLPLAGEPLEETCSISSERLNLSKRRAIEEMETNPQETPLFKNGGLSFIKRKTKIKKKLGAINFTQYDLNVDVSSESLVDDITGVKTAPRENKKNGVMNEEQREASVLHLEETSENLEESVADNSALTKVKRIKKKKYKLKEHEEVEPSVENQSVKTVQFSESQTAEIISKITKKKKRKSIPSNQTLDTDRPAELRGNDQSSEVPEVNEPECIQTSEEITECLMTNVTTLKPKKKKKKKRDETEESFYLDVSSMSQFDQVDGVVEQQVIEERPIDYNTAKHLDGNAPLILKAAKCKKKGQNASSSSDDIIGLKKQASGSQSESAEVVLQKKTKKKQKLKEQKNAELASDIVDDVHLFQQSEPPTTDSPSRKTKKKSANKDRERKTGSSSNEIFDHMCDRPLEMSGNNAIHSEINQFEHLKTSEEITRCSSPSVTKLSSGKKEKKKKDRIEKHQYDSVDVNLDASQLDVVSGLMGQKMIERRPGIGSAVEGNAEHVLKVAKRKKKSQNTSSPSQADDIIGLENTVSDLQSENMVECVEASKQKKKKKHKLLKGQEEAESGADNVHSVEMDQFSESQTTEKRTKKKRKDKGKTKTAHLEDNSGTEILSNETCEAPETELPEHTSEKTSGLKSERKKKKNGSEESQYVSQFDRSTPKETVEERLSDILEHTQAELNDSKHKKKRKQPSLSVNNGSEFSSSDAQMQETVAPERKRKKKNSDHITNGGGELIVESSDRTVLLKKSQRPMLKSLESITKKSKKKGITSK